jgi:hypothetical protein
MVSIPLIHIINLCCDVAVRKAVSLKNLEIHEIAAILVPILDAMKN